MSDIVRDFVFNIDPLRPIFAKLVRAKQTFHVKKWELPEEKLTVGIPDAHLAVAELKKNLNFIGGGEFSDLIHAKEYGNGIFAYYIIRTEKHTEKEQVLFEGYMIQQTEKLGISLQSKYSMSRYLSDLGYKPFFQREIVLWSFMFNKTRVDVLDVAGFGAMIEISIPPTKIEAQRKADELSAISLLESLGIKKQEITPVDSITLQYYIMQQMAAQQQAQQQQKSEKELSPEDLELLKKLLSEMPSDNTGTTTKKKEKKNEDISDLLG